MKNLTRYFPHSMAFRWQRHMLETVTLAFAFSVLAICYFTQSWDTNYFYNSDALTIFPVSKEAFKFHGNPSAWDFSNAPHFFPDYFIGLAAYWITPDIYRQIFISLAIQVGLFYWVIRRIACSFVPENGGRYAQLVLLSVLYLAQKGISPYVQLSLLNWHFGTYLAGLFYISIYVDLVARRMRGKTKKAPTMIVPSIVLLCAMAILMALSDSLFIVLFSAPLLSVGFVFLCAKRMPLRFFATVFALPFLCSAFGKLLASHVVPHFPALPIGFAAYGRIVPKIGEFWSMLTGLGSPAMVIGVLFFACFIRAAIVMRRQYGKDDAPLPESAVPLLRLFC